MKVEDVYRTHVATCSPTAPLRDVARRMQRGGAGIVVIVDDGKVAGVITESDLVRALGEDPHPRSATALSYASRGGVVTATLDDDISAAARRMIDAGVRHLPVVAGDDELIGIVSMRDLLTVEVFMPPRVPQGAG